MKTKLAHPQGIFLCSLNGKLGWHLPRYAVQLYFFKVMADNGQNPQVLKKHFGNEILEVKNFFFSFNIKC